MSRRLPPLAALRAFEAAGRHLSFSRAGEELSIGQSAVSHHIHALEASLGVPLFVRRTRAVDLTPAGARYLATVREAFDLLAQGTAEITAGTTASVRVALLASFATHWLMPRLGRFRERHPAIELRLDPAVAVADLASSGADLAIRCGRGGWTDGEARLLMQERIFPVMSPALMARGPAVAVPADLLAHELLFSYSPKLLEWDAWSRAVGLDLAGARRNMLHDYNIVVQAALDGQGVAIGRWHLLRDKLAAGQLVRPLAAAVHDDIGWWLVVPKRKPSRAAAAFAGWLVEEAAMDPIDSCMSAAL